MSRLHSMGGCMECLAEDALLVTYLAKIAISLHIRIVVVEYIALM